MMIVLIIFVNSGIMMLSRPLTSIIDWYSMAGRSPRVILTWRKATMIHDMVN